MRKAKWSWVAALAVATLVLAACSDVESSEPVDPGTGGHGDRGRSVRRRDDRHRGQPVGRRRGERQRGEGHHGSSRWAAPSSSKRSARPDQFPGMADGSIDATLEVWPSGHFDDRELYIDGEGTVVDGGELGIIGNIGWFMPSYVVEQNPEFATWEGFKDNADAFATAETGDKGRFLGADTTYSIYDEAIIESLGLDLEVVYSGSEAASLAALDQAVTNEEPILMYWWTPQWANAKYDLVEVELPPFDEECEEIAANDPKAVGYDCDYADDVLYKAFSADLETKDAGGVRVPLELRMDRGRAERRRAGDPGGNGRRGGRPDLDRRERGDLAGVVAGGLVAGSTGEVGAARGAGRPTHLLRRSRRRLGGGHMSEHVRLWIGGAWVDAEGGATSEATSPSTGEVIGTIAEGSRADAQRAIDAANAAAPAWAALSAFDRAAAMRRVAAAIDVRREDLAHTLALDQGKPLKAEANDEVEELIAYFEMAAADATRAEGLLPPSVDANKRVLLQRVPRGVVSIISPWNWPYTMPGEILAPAIAYGNAVVWAPAPTTSVCAAHMAECLEAADLPPGVVNMVTGPGPVVGDEIAASPGTQAVGFIGSIATGYAVASRAAGKELLLEMGGNGPLVIMDDGDLDKAVDATLVACFLNAGQSCTAGERILVHEDVREEYLARLSRAIDERIHLGDPFDDGTTLGPVNNEPTAAKTERHVTEARRSRSCCGGRRRARPRARIAPLLLRHGPRRCHGRDGDRARGDVRSGRARHLDPVRAGGDRSGERVALRPALGDLHEGPGSRAAVRGGRPHRLGQRERGDELLGVAPAVRRAGPGRRAASAAWADGSRWTASPS